MIKYKLTTLAQQDLESIWHYTIRNWSVNQAEKYIDGLLSTFDSIADRRIEGKRNYPRLTCKHGCRNSFVKGVWYFSQVHCNVVIAKRSKTV